MDYRPVRFRFLLMVAISLLGWLFICNATLTFATTVTISGRQIIVDGKPFTIKGVGYAPVPICIDPTTTSPYGDYFTWKYRAIYNRDMPLLRQMRANTIRLWGWNNGANHTDFLDKAYNNGINPLYVIVTFWMEPWYYNICDPEEEGEDAREAAKAAFKAMVAAHKNHPAVLMWAIGNEVNASWMYGGCLDTIFTLIDEMAQEAHEEEGENYHPVTTPLADIDLINTIALYDPLMPHLDLWSVQVYRGISFGSLFTDYAAVSGKPLAILEYNIDAYDNNNADEYENIGIPYQATYAEALWKEIEANSDICSGSTIMAYCDEWWKGKYGQSGSGCPDYDPCFHSTCGYPTASHHDGFSNEEWWGIMRTIDNGWRPDIMQPRVVYYTLQSLWTPYYILHKDGAIWSSDTSWEMGTPPYYAGSAYARDLELVDSEYKILHKDGAIYDSVAGWNFTLYYAGSDYAVDLEVTDSEATIILNRDGALWSSDTGWTLTSPPYYAGSDYARALEVRTDDSYVVLHKEGALYDSTSGWVMTTPPYYAGTEWVVDMKLDESGYVLLHRDGGLWSTAGGWVLDTPPYYASSDYARALELVGGDYWILHKDGALYDSVEGWNMDTPPYYPGSGYAVDLEVQ